jgi:hypothetical protein
MKTEAMEIKSCTKIGREIETYFRDQVLKPSSERQEQFIKEFNQNPGYAMMWYTEDVMIFQAAKFLWARCCVSVREAVTEAQAKDAVMNHVREVAKHVLRFPPRHNSTGEISNLQGTCENQAKCDFVQGASMIVGDNTFAL